MQHRHLAAGLCLAGVSLIGASLAGCGGGSAASAAGALGAGTAASLGSAGAFGPPDASLTGIHACQLIAGPTVSSVIGRLSEPAYQTPDGLACFYRPAVPGGVGPTIIVTVLKRSGYEASKAFVQGVEESNPKMANYVAIHRAGRRRVLDPQLHRPGLRPVRGQRRARRERVGRQHHRGRPAAGHDPDEGRARGTVTGARFERQATGGPAPASHSARTRSSRWLRRGLTCTRTTIPARIVSYIACEIMTAQALSCRPSSIAMHQTG